MKFFWKCLKEAAIQWDKDNALRLGAALSYYTVFSIGPLLILATGIAGLVFGAEAVRGELYTQLRGLLGDVGAKAIQGILADASKPESGILATVIGLVILVFGATGVFSELKSALNLVWNVEPSQSSGIKDFFRTRLLSFAMVLSIGFLLLVSLVVNTALAAASKYFTAVLPVTSGFFQISYTLFSFTLITVMFAMLFKFLPDTQIRWRDVGVGAALTAVLFTLGKFLIGLYLGRGTATSAFGASASVVVIMLWTYYSSLIFFYGAEFTQVFSTQYSEEQQKRAGRGMASGTSPFVETR